MRRFLVIIALLALGLNLTACDLWRGNQKWSPLQGKRISVFAHERTLKLETSIPLHITLPPARRNREGMQSGERYTHMGNHLKVNTFLNQIWQKKRGFTVNGRNGMLAHLIVADGRIYLIDSQAVVYAIDTQSGHTLWKKNLLQKSEGLDTLLAGGIAADGKGRVFVTTGWGSVVALRSDTGARLWHQRTGGGIPMRTAPTIRESRVFVLNRENEVRALAIESGEELWYRRGVAEVTTMLGGAPPAVDGSIVVVALSSGELVALRAENGKQMWSAPLGKRHHVLTNKSIFDVISQPIIYNGCVYAVSHNGLMVAINLYSGEKLWEIAIGSDYPPIVVNNFLFVLTTDGDLVALEAQSGRLVWITELPRWKNPEKMDERIYWTGPVLAGERLVVVSFHGKVVTLSPYTGSLLGESELQAEVRLPPFVADLTTYILTKSGNLMAYQ